MPETTLTAHTGREIGSSSTRRLRAEGKIPGVVYGHGTDPIPVAVVAREFQIAMSGEAGLNTLLSLKVDGKDHLTLARDIQHHPVRNTVTHVDFLIVRPRRADQRRGHHQPGGRGRRGRPRRRHRRPAAVHPPHQGQADRHPAVGGHRHLVADHRWRAPRVGHRHPRRRRARDRPRGHRRRRQSAPGPGRRGRGDRGGDRRGGRAGAADTDEG